MIFVKNLTTTIILTLMGFVTLMAQESIPVFDTFEELETYAFDRDTDTTYVVNFWATWCGPCVKELPYFEELAAKYQGKPFKQILVSLDFKNKIESRLITFIEKEKIASEVVLLADGKANRWIDKVDPNWSGAIPITIIYSKHKRAFYEREFHSVDELETELLKIYNH